MLGQFVSFWSGFSSVGMGKSGPGLVAHPSPHCVQSILGLIIENIYNMS